MALDSAGRPVVAYATGEPGNPTQITGDIALARCGDPSCTSDNVAGVLDAGEIRGLTPSLALDAQDRPIIAYSDANDQLLRIAFCLNPTCDGATRVVTFGQGHTPSLALDEAGAPVVAYIVRVGQTQEWALRVINCGDATCENATTDHVVMQGTGVGAPSLKLDASTR